MKLRPYQQEIAKAVMDSIQNGKGLTLSVEIALLRVKLRELVENQPDRIDLHFAAANTIARLVKTRYQISKEQKKSLKEAITKVLTEVAVPLGIGIGIKAASK